MIIFIGYNSKCVYSIDLLLFLVNIVACTPDSIGYRYSSLSVLNNHAYIMGGIKSNDFLSPFINSIASVNLFNSQFYYFSSQFVPYVNISQVRCMGIYGVFSDKVFGFLFLYFTLVFPYWRRWGC